MTREEFNALKVGDEFVYKANTMTITSVGTDFVNASSNGLICLFCLQDHDCVHLVSPDPKPEQPTTMETETRPEPQIESVLNALRAFMNGRQLERVIQLEERCRNQAVEINKLQKRDRSIPKLPGFYDRLKPGSKVIDGFGRVSTIETFGPYGFVAKEGGTHAWSSYAPLTLAEEGE